MTHDVMIDAVVAAQPTAIHQNTDKDVLSHAEHDATQRVAAALHSATTGNATAALQQLLAVLRVSPHHIGALHGAGLVALQLGQLNSAERFLGRALAEISSAPTVSSLTPATIADDLVTIIAMAAAQLEHATDLAGAEAAYRRLITVQPQHQHALSRLVAIALAHGDLDTAQDAHRELAAVYPTDFATLYFGAELAALAGDNARAVERLSQALALQPKHLDAGRLRAVLLSRLGRHKDAIEQLNRCIAVHPHDMLLSHELARQLHIIGRASAAEREQARATALQNERGAAMAPSVRAAATTRDFNSAHAAVSAYIAEHPTESIGFTNRGYVLDLQREQDPAARAFARACDLDPGDPLAAVRWSTRLGFLGISEAARTVLDRLLLRAPALPAARLRRLQTLPHIPPSAAMIEHSRARLMTDLADLKRDPLRMSLADLTHISTNFWLCYQGRDDRDIQRDIATVYQSGCPELAFVAPHVHRRSTRARLRVGFLSSFFRQHTITDLFGGLMLKLDRARFEIVMITALVGRPDDTTGQLEASVDQTVHLHGGLLDMQQTLAALELDVLVYPDVGMSNIPYFLAHGRFARVQCTSWGHPVTTGIKTIDHFISSKWIEPADSAVHYTERLVQFNELPCYYTRPTTSERVNRVDIGMPEQATIYYSPQTLFKFHPDFDSIIAGILRNDPRGVVALINGNSPIWTTLLRNRLHQSMPDVADRIVFLERMSTPRFIASLACVDVLLDPLHFGSGNTMYQGFASGTPIITLPGEFMRGRCVTGAYQRMGYTDMVATSPADYIARAINIANDRDARARACGAIAEASRVLFESQASVIELEDFLLHTHTASFTEGPLA